MKRDRFLFIAVGLIGFLGFFLSGCGSVMNPYKSEFTCPQAEQGKCVGVDSAYEESLKAEKLKKVKSNNQTEEKEIKGYYPSLKGDELEENLIEEKLVYTGALFDKLTKVLKSPQTPVMTMPQVIRILILPYQGEKGKTLYFSRYVFTILDEPRWVLDNFLKEDKLEKEE